MWTFACYCFLTPTLGGLRVHPAHFLVFWLLLLMAGLSAVGIKRTKQRRARRAAYRQELLDSASKWRQKLNAAEPISLPKPESAGKRTRNWAVIFRTSVASLVTTLVRGAKSLRAGVTKSRSGVARSSPLRHVSMAVVAVGLLGMGFGVRGIVNNGKIRELDWVYVQNDIGQFDYDFLLPDGTIMHGHYCPTESEPKMGHGEIVKRLRWIMAYDCWSRIGVEPAYTFYRDEAEHVIHTTEAAYRSHPETQKRARAGR